MGNGKNDHFDTDTIVNQAVGDLVGLPVTHRTDHTVCLEVVNDDTLPPREEHDTLHTQELAERTPVDRVAKFVVDSVKELNETVQRVHDRNVEDERDVGVGLVPLEASLTVHSNCLQTKGKESRAGPDHDIL